MEDDHITLVVNLKVLARLKKGQKLNTRAHHFRIEDSPAAPLSRWLRGESRLQLG